MPLFNRSGTTLFAALACAMIASAAWAGDAPPTNDTQAQAETEQPPLAPPPGISVIPSMPMRPPQANGQVPGCPAQSLKPLELLV